MKFAAATLEAWLVAALRARGVPDADAELTAECVLGAELEGQGSHGLLRVPFLLRRLDAGLIEARPRLRRLEERPAVVLLDGANGLGPVVGVRAMDIAIARARSAGIGACAVRNGNHLGSVGFYVERAAAQGLVALAFGNTPPAMAPPGGRTAYLGTNPIAAGFPTSGHPVVIDLATSQVARGRVLKAQRDHEPIPEGWALDAAGRPTRDPAAALAGSLVPLGGDKGFALALMVEVLSGVLAGSAIGPEVGGTFAGSDRPSNCGHLFLALDPSAFGPGFIGRMDSLAAAIRGVEPVDPARPVRLPGDRRRAERALRLAAGVELSEALVAELEALGGRIDPAA